jgi:putative transposase
MFMPRCARIKNETGIYHIIVRSISDVPLFKDSQDKDKYLELIKKYQTIFLFKVYAYCLMTTHAHIAIDCCGADISKIMKSINQCYASYFNNKYNRHGHVFQDRFKSKLVDNTKYLITLSAYIHNNPSDIEEFKDNVENYKYSSLGIYLGIAKDIFHILNYLYILSHFGNKLATARKSYFEIINRLSHTIEKVDIEFKYEIFQSRNERKILIRNFSPEDIIKFIAKYTGTPFNIHIKFIHENAEIKSLCVLIMRSLCNFTLKEIASIAGNITTSNMYRLCEKGYRLITLNEKYMTLIEDIIHEYSVA